MAVCTLNELADGIVRALNRLGAGWAVELHGTVLLDAERDADIVAVSLLLCGALLVMGGSSAFVDDGSQFFIGQFSGKKKSEKLPAKTADYSRWTA